MSKLVFQSQSASDWSTANPPLGIGVLGIENSTNPGVLPPRLKFGTGALWNSTLYLDQIGYTKAQIDALFAGSEHFKGTYANAGALASAHPTADEGDYAFISDVGVDAVIWLWDGDDSAWVEGGGTGGVTPDATESVAGKVELLSDSEYDDVQDLVTNSDPAPTAVNKVASNRTLYKALAWLWALIGAKVSKVGDTMTGLLDFSGTGHAGIRLNNLTQSAINALSKLEGMIFANTTTKKPNYFDGVNVREILLDPLVIGEVFDEPWANLSNWTNVGTPVASVTGGELSLAGTPSLSTNSIRCSGYGTNGVTNATFAMWTWYEDVNATPGASNSGIAFGIVSQNPALSTISIHVNLELSSTGTGFINWYYGGNSTPIQTSEASLPSIVNGDRIFFELINLRGSLTLRCYTANGRGVTDTLILSRPKTSLVAINYPVGAQFYWHLMGGTHSIGNFKYFILDKSRQRVLKVGDSITFGMSVTSFGRIEDPYVYNCYGGLQFTDVNIAELEFYEADNLYFSIGTNDIAVHGLATAQSRLATFITNVGAIGYSVANANLYAGTVLPRGSADYATFRADVITAIGNMSYIVDHYAVADNGTNSLDSKKSNDGIHPNSLLSALMVREEARVLGLPKNTYQFGNTTSGHGGPSPRNTPVLIDLSESAVNSTVTMDVEELATGFITSTSASAVTATTCTAAELISYTEARKSNMMPLIVDNTLGASAFTIALGSGMSIINSGSLVVGTGQFAIFTLYFNPNLTTVSWVRHPFAVCTSGGYVPTLTGVANVTGTTAYSVTFLRNLNGVAMFGKVSVDPTIAATLTRFRMSLPTGITSAFVGNQNAAGCFNASDGSNMGGAIIADFTNDELEFLYTPTNASNHDIHFSCGFTVLF